MFRVFFSSFLFHEMRETCHHICTTRKYNEFTPVRNRRAISVPGVSVINTRANAVGKCRGRFAGPFENATLAVRVQGSVPSGHGKDRGLRGFWKSIHLFIHSTVDVLMKSESGAVGSERFTSDRSMPRARGVWKRRMNNVRRVPRWLLNSNGRYYSCRREDTRIYTDTSRAAAAASLGPLTLTQNIIKYLTCVTMRDGGAATCVTGRRKSVERSRIPLTRARIGKPANATST